MKKSRTKTALFYAERGTIPAAGRLGLATNLSTLRKSVAATVCFVLLALTVPLASISQRVKTYVIDVRGITTVQDSSGNLISQRLWGTKDTLRVPVQVDTVRVPVPVDTTGTTPPATPPPTGGVETLIYQNGFDRAGDVTSNQLGRGGLNVSAAYIKTGAGSFMSYVQAGDAQTSGGWRSEQQYSVAQTPVEGSIEYDVMYTEPFASQGHSFQLHPNQSGPSATLALWHSGGKFQVVRQVNWQARENWYGKATMTIVKNKWYHMRWEYKMSTGTDGYWRLWIDGVLYDSQKGVKTATGLGQYLKLGQNLFNGTTTGRAYYDNLQVWRAGR